MFWLISKRVRTGYGSLGVSWIVAEDGPFILNITRPMTQPIRKRCLFVLLNRRLPSRVGESRLSASHLCELGNYPE